MQAIRFNPAIAAMLAALCFTLSFSSCKKKDGDPSPTNPPGTLKCKPVLEQELSTGDTIRSYQYDAQGRIERFVSNTSFGADGLRFTATVTYNPDGSIDVFKPEANHYIVNNGRFTQALIGRADTLYYDYTEEQLTTIRFRVNSFFEPSLDYNYNDVITYSNGLPSTVTTSYYDGSGYSTPYVKTTYTYDMTREVSYNTFSPFNIAPGLQIIKVNRMLTKMDRQALNPISQDGHTDFLNEYDGDKPQPTKVTLSSSGWTYSAGIVKFTYKCD